MENVKQNKMADMPMKKLFWKMGLPMIISMVLQALYNVVDSIFVTNMGEQGAIANQALTLAFPIQILIIAIGVGTGIGLNTLLSKNLGENNKEQVNNVAGNGIFISICIFILFFLFGMFGSKWFISLFSAGNEEIISMGTTYLKICCCFSLGSIAYTAYERFLQATGKTNLSAIAQISGAIANIVLDYIFIFPLNMGVAGAAWATVIGQFLSLFVAIIFHYTVNKEIDKNLKYIKPDLGLIKGIYSIGLSAAIMQSLLSVMMAGMNAILGTAKADPTILVGSFGIYYKIQNIAVLACFGLSNTPLDFNQAMNQVLEWLESRGFRAEAATLGRFGKRKGMPVGMQTSNEKVGFRVEFDERSGAHINVWAGKEKGPHFQFAGSEKTVERIQNPYSCKG